MHILCYLLLWIGLLFGPVPVLAQSRVALVFGNSTYQNVSALPNPVNDASDISVSLKRLGFDVKTLTDAKFDDMRRALIGFGQQARGAEFAVIFFAGHGMEIAGENWLIPVDAQLATDLDVANETISLQSLTRAVSSTTKLGLIILDACRSNPFLPKMQRTNLTRAVDRGFVRVEPNDNILVAYSARDGTTANDGSGRNSPFTSSLLRNIEIPGLEVRFLFANVRDDVMAATKREQQPFTYGSLSKDLVYLISLAEPALGNPLQGARLSEPINPHVKTAKANADPENAVKTIRVTSLPYIGLTVAPAVWVAGFGREGVVVTEVKPNSRSAERGFKKNDVVLEVAGKAVGSPAEVGDAINAARAGKKTSVLFRVRSYGTTRFVAMPIPTLDHDFDLLPVISEHEPLSLR
jgi:hypothetical protein